MSKIRKTVRSLGAAAAAAGVAFGIAALVPGTAGAATYGGQCGAGFNAVSQRQVSGGTVFLAAKGDVACAVTIRDSSGSARSMSVWIRELGGVGWINDPGNFTTYAGPVYTSALFYCAEYGGRIESSQVTAYQVCWA
jgi:hypothetical protein